MMATSLLGLTREELLALWPNLIVHDDADEIQEGDTDAYALHPDGEFEVVLNAARVVDTVFVNRQSPLLSGIIDFTATRRDVLAQFGTPSRSGDEQVVQLLGEQGAWDRFDFPDWSLHVQYVPRGENLGRVTVMTPEVARHLSGDQVVD